MSAVLLYCASAIAGTLSAPQPEVLPAMAGGSVVITGRTFDPGTSLELPEEIQGALTGVTADRVEVRFDGPVRAGTWQIGVRQPDGSLDCFDITFGNPGCALEPIYFDTNLGELRPDALSALASNLACLRVSGIDRVMVSGHADERGELEQNRYLSAERAHAVESWLLEHIPRLQVQRYAFGEEAPVAVMPAPAVGDDDLETILPEAEPEQQQEVWQENRRVEIRPVRDALCPETRVSFTAGQADLDAASEEPIRLLATCLTHHRIDQVYVFGTEDAFGGTDDLPAGLARLRADRVASILRAQAPQVQIHTLVWEPIGHEDLAGYGRATILPFLPLEVPAPDRRMREELPACATERLREDLQAGAADLVPKTLEPGGTAPGGGDAQIHPDGPRRFRAWHMDLLSVGMAGWVPLSRREGTATLAPMLGLSVGWFHRTGWWAMWLGGGGFDRADGTVPIHDRDEHLHGRALMAYGGTGLAADLGPLVVAAGPELDSVWLWRRLMLGAIEPEESAWALAPGARLSLRTRLKGAVQVSLGARYMHVPVILSGSMQWSPTLMADVGLDVGRIAPRRDSGD